MRWEAKASLPKGPAACKQNRLSKDWLPSTRGELWHLEQKNIAGTLMNATSEPPQRAIPK